MDDIVLAWLSVRATVKTEEKTDDDSAATAVVHYLADPDLVSFQ